LKIKQQTTALLSQEGQRDREAHPAGGGSKTEAFRDGNHPSHDLDFVSIMLPKSLNGFAPPGSPSLRS
jgi:hypothetical protein